MEPALPLDYVEFDPHVEHTGDISDMSAEQYLSWVRSQASNLPSVVRVEVDCSQYLSKQTTYMPALVDISPCPDEFVPAEDWIRSVIHSFSVLRLSLNKASSSDSSKERKIVVPQLKDRESWYKFCFGDHTSPILSSEGEDELVTDSNLDSIEVRKAKLVDQFNSILSNAECVSSDEEDEEGEGEEDGDSVEEDRAAAVCAPQQWQGGVKVVPTSALMCGHLLHMLWQLQFDQVLTQRLLGYHIDWLCSAVAMEEDARDYTSSSSSISSRARTRSRRGPALSELQSQWLYSLLSRLQKPLHSDMTAAIRALYRTCCQLRYESAIQSQSLSGAEGYEGREEELARLNIMIAICGSYFGQSEELACLYEGEHDSEGCGDVEGESMEEDDEYGEEEENVVEEECEDENEDGEEEVAGVEEDECRDSKKRRLQSDVVGNSDSRYELEEGEEIES